MAPFALNTVEQMTGNLGFTTPHVPLATMTTKANALTAAIAAAQGGGLAAMVARDAARLDLDLKLREQAAYVQSLAGTNLPLLVSSGFLPASTNRARIVLPQVVIKSLVTLQSGVFKITVHPPPTARGYELRYKNGTGDYINGGIFTSSRNIILQGLTPGSTYTVQVRAIGGLTGYSDWSDPILRMAI